MHIHFTNLGPEKPVIGTTRTDVQSVVFVRLCMCVCVCILRTQWLPPSLEMSNPPTPNAGAGKSRTLSFNQRVLQASQSLSRTCGEGRPENSARIVFPGKRADSGNGECCTESATHRFAPAFALFTLGSLPSLPNHPLWYFKNH